MNSSGRPSKACGTCKSQKTRCSGDRPTCQRCRRLKHICIYGNQNGARVPPRPPSYARVNQASVARREVNPTTIILPSLEIEERFHGIPRSLLWSLIDLYFDNAYNAHLLLHKRDFVRSIRENTTRTHVVLSVCAWAANFFQETDGKTTLKDHGFMVEWAERAGRLVNQELPELHEDNFVTCVNLSLFWHSQGSWRIAHLYKGNAYNLLTILGVGSKAAQKEISWRSELRRRRCWAGYLMHCHNSSPLSSFPLTNITDLALPWPESDFEAGTTITAPITLNSRQGNGGIFAEIIKILSLWSSVLAFIKTSDSSLSKRLPEIYALHEKLSAWRRALAPDMYMTPSVVAGASKDMLHKILLISIVYHQSICVLHASIVPIFCWGEGDDTWGLARQVSAQLAYEHACTITDLFSTVLSAPNSNLSAMPNFVAYAAYCGCAIQIPFAWSANESVKEKALANVKTNMKILDTMALYWRFAALLKIYVRCLYNGHKKHPVILEDEPKNIGSHKLTDFQMKDPHVQASILEFNSILYSPEEGYTRPGEENRFQIGDFDATGRQTLRKDSDNRADSSIMVSDRPNVIEENTGPAESSETRLTPNLEDQCEDFQPQAPHNQQLMSAAETQLGSDLPMDNQFLDIFQPLSDPEMAELFPHGELPNLPIFAENPSILDYFDLETWR